MAVPSLEQEFDLDRYLRASKRVDLGGVRWGDAAQFTLSPEEVFCLHYMMDIETHTVVYLRDLLVTRAVRDPQVTSFLSCWVYEELWHGSALTRDFVAVHMTWGAVTS